MTNKRTVLVTTKHAGDIVEFLSSTTEVQSSTSSVPLTGAQLMEQLQDKDAVVSVLQDRFDKAVFAKLSRLKIVANVAVGYDNINVADATQAGVLVLNTPGVLDETTAEFAFTLMLAVSRRVVEADRYVRGGLWQQWASDLLLGTDVSGKTLGIIGLGRIGQAMARRARGFNMKILYNQRGRMSLEREKDLGASFRELDALLEESDFVSLHCPLTNDTRHLLGEKQFARMKSTAFLVNTARGAVVDESALVKALKGGQIAGAGLDVFEKEPSIAPELLAMDNVVLAPHIGSASTETRSAMARLAAEGLIAALQGRLPDNSVNPEVWPAFLKRLKAEPTVV